MEGERARTWLVAATRPRMLALLALFLLAAVACGLLGAWQLDRARERGEQAAQRAAAQEAQADPVPLADVLAPQTALTQDALARRVRVTGTWVPGTDLVVPDQEHGGEDGSVLIAALRVDDGGAVLPVARGWVALDAAAAAHAAAAGGPLAPSGGRVSLVGSLAAAQAAAPAAGPGQVGSISPAQLVNLWGGPIYDAYLRLDVADPPEAAPLVPLPVATSQSASLDLQNLAYAAQWWIFGGFAVFLWARLVRDEAERRTGHPAG